MSVNKIRINKKRKHAQKKKIWEVYAFPLQQLDTKERRIKFGSESPRFQSTVSKQGLVPVLRQCIRVEDVMVGALHLMAARKQLGASHNSFQGHSSNELRCSSRSYLWSFHVSQWPYRLCIKPLTHEPWETLMQMKAEGLAGIRVQVETDSCDSTSVKWG